MPYLGNDLQVAQPSYRNIDDISGSFNSSTTSFPLLVSGSAPVPFPINSNQCLISVAGVVQRPDDSGTEGFRISSGNIIFSSAPSTGADFFGVILAGADYVNVGANFPSGSAAVPSITFDSDLDTGIYNSAANQVSITTAGTERLRIDSAGQIESVSLGSASAPAFSFTTDPNTGIYSPGADQVAISTNGTGRLFVNSSGSVGIGTSSPSNALTVQSTSRPQLHVSYNGNGGIYLTSANDVARTNWQIASSETTANTLQIYPSDSVGGTTFTTPAVTIDASRRVGIGTTAPEQLLHIGGNNGIRFGNAAATPKADISYTAAGDEFLDIKIQGTTTGYGNIRFSTGPTPSERARIDSSGRLLVGTSSAGGSQRLIVQNGIDTTFTNLPTNVALVNSGAFAAGLGAGINFVASVDGSNVTTFGAISGIKENATSGNTAGALVFGTRDSAGSTSMERMRITSDAFITNKTSFIDSLPAGGFTLAPNRATFSSSNSLPMRVNRDTSDGDLITFHQDSTQEGSISVSGSTVSYNGAHLSRWSQLPSGAERIEILRGSVLSNLDEMCEWGDEDNEQLNRMKVSDVEGDKNVSGVFQAWDDDDDTYTNDFYCAMTGDFIIRIAAGVTVERGDLLMSAGDGTAKPQDDDIIRSKTIAKVTSTNVSCTYDDGSYCVPCVLMAC